MHHHPVLLQAGHKTTNTSIKRITYLLELPAECRALRLQRLHNAAPLGLGLPALALAVACPSASLPAGQHVLPIDICALIALALAGAEVVPFPVAWHGTCALALPKSGPYRCCQLQADTTKKTKTCITLYAMHTSFPAPPVQPRGFQ